MLQGCQGSFSPHIRRWPCKLMNPERGRTTLLGRACPAQALQAMAVTGFAICLRVVFPPPIFYLLVLSLGLLMWIISKWTYWILSIMAGSFPNPLPQTYSDKVGFPNLKLPWTKKPNCKLWWHWFLPSPSFYLLCTEIILFIAFKTSTTGYKAVGKQSTPFLIVYFTKLMYIFPPGYFDKDWIQCMWETL